MKCLECGIHVQDGKSLSNHIKKVHGISGEDYAIKHFYSGVRPHCKCCDNETRYVSFSFKEYCKDHASIAMQHGGQKGGVAEAWNKGKSKDNDERLFEMSKKVSGENNSFWGKSHSDETKRRISKSKTISANQYEKRVNERDEFFPITRYEDYRSRQNQYLEFECSTCGFINKKTLQAFERGSLCNNCNTISSSQAEKEILHFVRSIEPVVLSNDRKIIYPKELDIVIPEKKLAIEYNGLYWHSDLSPGDFDKNSHLSKTKMMISNDWSLFHVFSDEWLQKKEIVKSMISNKLMMSKRVFARNLDFRVVSKDDRKKFFNQNHISGDVNARYSYGLFQNEELISCISFRKPIQKKWSNFIEIARFATKLNTMVVGGLSKLIKHSIPIIKENELDLHGIMTYADRRFGEGNAYRKAGFSYYGDTGLDYWYTDGIKRINRFCVKARDGLSESVVAHNMGVGKVYGCGSNIFVRDI